MRKDSGLNVDRLLKLLGLLDEALKELKDLRKVDRNTLLTSRDRFAMEQLFYRAGMISIDICFHLAAFKGSRVPETYRDCFSVLMEAGVIDADLKHYLSELAGLRNFLAHVYWDIDYERLYGFLEELEPLERFRDAVLQFLKSCGHDE